jgi:hypothetical protein
MSSPPATAALLEWALFYIDEGCAPLPVPFKTKEPPSNDWPNLRLTRVTAPDHFNSEPINLGLLLGAASGGLTDGDLDCREAVILADRFLPTTRVKFGREGTGASHRVWRVNPPSLPTTKFEDVGKGLEGERATLLEIRDDGAQTIFPPSVHPRGERVTFISPTFAPGEARRVRSGVELPVFR